MVSETEVSVNVTVRNQNYVHLLGSEINGIIRSKFINLKQSTKHSTLRF
jgi:hypothetical protein